MGHRKRISNPNVCESWQGPGREGLQDGSRGDRARPAQEPRQTARVLRRGGLQVSLRFFMVDRF